jgi:hypothetical protein
MRWLSSFRNDGHHTHTPHHPPGVAREAASRTVERHTHSYLGRGVRATLLTGSHSPSLESCELLSTSS